MNVFISSGIGIIRDLEITLLIIFNAGIVVRIMKIVFDGMEEEDYKSQKNRIINHIKALVVVNTAYGLISVIKNYYK